MPDAKVAFIGGSGLYDLDGLTDRREVEVDTPFGAPSDAIVLGVLGGMGIAFLPRHGRGHRISPTEIPARANIYALKSLGVERVISISAVGSLIEKVKPLDLVVPDQLIDRTRSRVNTFFEEGIVVHVAFADPFCPVLTEVVANSARHRGVPTHMGGSCVVIEGPQFSTRAESELYRSWGGTVVGMTALPEARLAREAEICYATMAFVTDYDCWHEAEESVSVELVVANLLKNVEVARAVAREVVLNIPVERECPCAFALKDSIITSRKHISEAARDRVALFVDKYLNVQSEVQ